MSITKIKKSVIREDLLSITGDYRKAIILNQFIYWSERVDDADKFIKKENEIAQSNGEETRELFYGWIYKSADEMAEEIMLGLSSSQVRRHISGLVDMGYLSKRNNPKYKWDRTLQYRVNLVNIAKALKANGYSLNDYKISIPEDNEAPNAHQCAINNVDISNRTVSNEGAIPDITTDNIDVDIYASCPRQSVRQATPPTSYIDQNSFTKDELHRHLVQRTKKFFPDSENNKGSVVELTKIIEYFYAKYEEELGEKHPVLSDRALGNITVRYLYPSGVLDTYSVYEFDDYKDLIDRYFTVDYGKYRNGNSPYQGEIALSLSHFMSDTIRENLFKNVTGIPY